MNSPALADGAHQPPAVLSAARAQLDSVAAAAVAAVAAGLIDLIRNERANKRNVSITPGAAIEFSRAVHAEMEAPMSAARTKAQTVNTRLSGLRQI